MTVLIDQLTLLMVFCTARGETVEGLRQLGGLGER